MLGFSPLGSKALGDNASSPNNIVSDRVGISIAASDSVGRTSVFGNNAYVLTAYVESGYVDTVIDNNTVLFNTVSATANIVRVYRTLSSPSTISENTIGETSTGGATVSAPGLYQYDFEAFELQINADDTVVFRPALRESFAETAEIQISASDVVEQLFVYNNNAGLNLGDFDVSYEFEGLPVVFQDDYPGLPVGPISFNAIGDIQYEGPQNNQPGLVELTIGAVATEVKSVSRDTQGDLFIAVFDNDDGSEGVVRADGKLVFPWFYPKFAYEEAVVTFKSIAASSSDYVFQGLSTDIKSSYPMLPIGPLSVNAIGEVQWEGPQNNQPGLVELTIGVVDDIIKIFVRDSTVNLELAAIDNQGPGVIRPADGIIEYPHFRPVLRVSTEDNLTLEIDFVDDPSAAYAFPSAGIDRLLREPGLPLGPLSVSTISEEQYEGLMDFQPSLLELTIDEPSPIEVIINYPLDIGSLAIGVDQTVVFRPALRELFAETAPLQVSVQDSSYLFEYPLIYSNAGPGLPIGPISANSIAEEQILLGSLAEIYEYSDTLFISVAAQDQIETNRLEIEIDTVAILEITVNDTVSVAYPSVEIVSTEVVIADSIQQLFVFDDTAQFVQITVDLIAIAADYDTVLFNTVGAVDFVESTLVFDDSSVLELAADDIVELKSVFVDESAANIEIAIDDVYEIAYAYVTSGNFEISNLDSVAVISSYADNTDLAVSDVTIQNSVRNFNDTAAFTKISIDSIDIVANYDTVLLNVVLVTDSIEIEYNHIDNVALEINTTDNVEKVNNLNEVFDLNITTTDTVEQLFVFDDTAQFVQLTADSTAVIADYDTVIFNTVAVIDAVEQLSVLIDSAVLEVAASSPEVISEASAGAIIITADSTVNQVFVFDDTAQFVQLTADSFEIVADYDTVIFNALAITDTVEQLFVVNNTADLVVDVNSPEIIGETSTVSLSIAVDSAVNQVFVFDDTAQFVQLTADSTAIVADYDTVIFNTLTVADAIEQLFVFDDTAQFVQLTADSTAIVADYDTVIFTNITAIDTTTATLTATDNLVINLVSADSIQQLFVFDDTAQFVQLAVTDTIKLLVFDTVVTSIITARDITTATLTAIDNLVINLASADSIQQLFVFDDTAQFVQLTADSTAIVADYDTVIFNTLTVADAIEQLFVFDDARALEIAASSPEIISEASTGVIIVDAADAIEQLFVFDDTAQFVQLTADSTAIVADYDTVIFNTVAVIDAIQQLFVFDDTAQFVQLAVTDTNAVSVVDTVIASTVNVTDNVSTSLTATDNVIIDLDSVDTIEQLFVFDDTAQFVQLAADSTAVVSDYDTVLFNIINVASTDSTTLVFADSAVLEIAASSPLSIGESSTGEITVGATDAIEQLFVFDDAVDFVQFVAASTEFIADYDTVLFASVAATDTVEQLFVFDDTARFVQLAASDNAVVNTYETILLPVIEIVDAVATVSNIVDTTDIELAATQSIGITEASIGQLVLAAPSIQTVAYNIENTVGFVKFVAASEEATLTSTESLAFNIGAISVENVVYTFDDTADFVQFVAESTEVAVNYDTVLFNIIAVQSDISNTLNSVENITVELQALADLDIIYNIPAATVDLETEVISAVGISYVFDDFAQFANFVVSDTDYIAVFDTITANSIAAEDSVTQSFNFVPQAFIEIDDAAIQSFTYAFDDTGNFVKVSADSTELSVNIDNEGVLELGIADEVSFVFSITSAAFAEIESFDDVSKSVSDRSFAAIEWNAKTFAKGYTKWQQIYADDTVGLTLKGQGDGMKISAVQQVSRQQWIG